MADWVAIRAEYISTQISTRDLAKKHGVSYSTLRKKSEKEGWTEARKEQVRRTGAKIAQKLADQQVNHIASLIADGSKAQELLSRFLDEMEQSGDIKPAEIKTITSALKDLRDLYKVDSGADDVKYQKARELLGGVPDALDG